MGPILGPGWPWTRPTARQGRFLSIFLTEKHSGWIHNVESSGTKLHVDFLPSST